eukprot:gene41185-50981_t
MQPWNQIYAPLGSLALSALAAAVPIIFFFVALAILRIKGHVAGGITLALALIVAIFAYGMPVPQALASAAYGFAYGLWPIAWIIITAVFLYKIVERTGQLAVIRASILAITDDQRLQMLLIGFSFGAFLEGAAGFGAPVAITAALLVGLGFNPLYAAGMCLIANTAPVAFGAMGIPIIVAGQVTGIDAMHIGAMAGRQLPLLSLFVPFWLVFMMDGMRGVKEVWPGALVAGGTFAVTQYFTSNYIGPELPDITSALASLVSLTLLLKVWQPASAKRGARGVVNMGRAGTRVTPLAVCAMGPATGTRSNTGAAGGAALELLQHGFRFGVSYNLLKLNAQHNTELAEYFLVDPIQPAGAGPAGAVDHTADAVLAPFMCTGTVQLPQVTGVTLRLRRPAAFTLGEQLNSRLGVYGAGALACLPATAPPDTNVRRYNSVGSWMSPAPAAASATPAPAAPGQPYNTMADRASAAGAADYGPLWAYSSARQSANGAAISRNQWPWLYPVSAGALPTAPNYNTPAYFQTTAAYYLAPVQPNVEALKGAAAAKA